MGYKENAENLPGCQVHGKEERSSLFLRDRAPKDWECSGGNQVSGKERRWRKQLGMCLKEEEFVGNAGNISEEAGARKVRAGG